jgi:hypothetical protein
MDYSKLKAKLPEPRFKGLSDDAISDILNDPIISQFKVVEYTHVASYLMRAGKYLDIVESDLYSARCFMLSMNTFATFDIRKEGVELAVDESLLRLIKDNLITLIDKQAIFSLAKGKPISEAQSEGFKVKPGYIPKARAL